jgi:hypothetical protein
MAEKKLQMKVEFIKKKMEMKSRIWEMMSDILEEEGEEETIEGPATAEG